MSLKREKLSPKCSKVEWNQTVVELRIGVRHRGGWREGDPPLLGLKERRADSLRLILVLSWSWFERSNGEGRSEDPEGSVMDTREVPAVRTGWDMMVDERGEEAVRYIGGPPPPTCLGLWTGWWQSNGTVLTSPGRDWESAEHSSPNSNVRPLLRTFRIWVLLIGIRNTEESCSDVKCPLSKKRRAPCILLPRA